MPGPSIVWDYIRTADIKNNFQYTEVRRTCGVRDLPLVIDPTSGTDPSYLLRCMGVSGFPKLLDPFPNPLYNWLIVQQRNLIAVINKNSVRYEIVYRGIPPITGSLPLPSWVVTDGYTTSYVQTYATAFGGKPLTTWYKKGATGAAPPFTGPNNTVLAGPVGSQVKAGKALKLVSHRSATALANISSSYWDTIKTQYRNMAGSINADTWNGQRGEWYFVGPRTRTQGNGIQVLLECTFLFQRGGHYPLLPWFTHLGEHPADSVSAIIGQPAVDDIISRNGLTMCSVQGETLFNNLFSNIVL